MSERIYRLLLRFYPPEFRARFADELFLDFQSLCHELRDHPWKFRFRIGRDLAVSIPRENIRMLTARGIRRLILLQSVLLTVVATVVALLCYLVAQQVLRQSANYPQVQMAHDTALRMDEGVN